MEPFELLDRHVAAFNMGVTSGDWNPMVEGFTPDGELHFVGVPAGPFRGRYTIAEAYREQPPDDEIAILEASVVGGEVVAAYSWRKDDGAKSGLLLIQPYKAKIQRLVMTFEPG
jgi:hypothetical protein